MHGCVHYFSEKRYIPLAYRQEKRNSPLALDCQVLGSLELPIGTLDGSRQGNILDKR